MSQRDHSKGYGYPSGGLDGLPRQVGATGAGITPGRRIVTLNRSAKIKADLIARCGTLSHTACGASWNGGLRSVGFRGLAIENLAAGSGRSATARAAMGMWLGSSGHRKALLDRRVTVFGVGVCLRVMVNGWRGSVWALHLGRPYVDH